MYTLAEDLYNTDRNLFNAIVEFYSEGVLYNNVMHRDALTEFYNSYTSDFDVLVQQCLDYADTFNICTH